MDGTDEQRTENSDGDVATRLDDFLSSARNKHQTRRMKSASREAIKDLDEKLGGLPSSFRNRGES